MSTYNCSLAFVCVVFCVALGCKPAANNQRNVPLDYHASIKAKQIRPSLFSAPVHGSGGEYNSLVIGEREFRDVRGFPPYYFDIPEQQRIVFVTGKWGLSDAAVIHVHDFKTGQHVEFKIPGNSRMASFGSQVGGRDRSSLNVLEHSSTSELVVADIAWDMLTKRTATLDLVSQKIAKVEVFYFDENRTATNRFIENVRP
jgi:hypothetical protein